MYIYFKNTTPLEIKIPQGKWRVIKFKPSICNGIHNFLWNLLAKVNGGKFFEYHIVSESDTVLSKAQVIDKIWIFPFMKERGIHIGPCETIESERGKGFYPYLLKYIMDDNPYRVFYMIVDEKNISSIKGVEKVGFSPFGKGLKSRFGRYIIK